MLFHRCIDRCPPCRNRAARVHAEREPAPYVLQRYQMFGRRRRQAGFDCEADKAGEKHFCVYSCTSASLLFSAVLSHLIDLSSLPFPLACIRLACSGRLHLATLEHLSCDGEEALRLRLRLSYCRCAMQRGGSSLSVRGEKTFRSRSLSSALCGLRTHRFAPRIA